VIHPAAGNSYTRLSAMVLSFLLVTALPFARGRTSRQGGLFFGPRDIEGWFGRVCQGPSASVMVWRVRPLPCPEVSPRPPHRYGGCLRE